MARQAHNAGRRPEMPFEVNHALWGKIKTQVTDGLRMAILSGFYKPGDILPSQIELACALGALTALLAAGIHTGRDVLVATLANMGIAPVHPDPIDLLARDPERDASVVADAVLAYLDSGVFPSDLTLGTEFVAGATK